MSQPAAYAAIWGCAIILVLIAVTIVAQALLPDVEGMDEEDLF